MNYKLMSGIALIILGIVLGVYLGVFVLFIGGITQIVEQVNLDVVDGSVVAWGIAKIVSATFLGFVSALALIIPGFYRILNS